MFQTWDSGLVATPTPPSHQELKDSHLLPISEDKVVEGKGQSPFDPAHKHTAVLVGEYQVPWSIPTSVFPGHSVIYGL